MYVLRRFDVARGPHDGDIGFDVLLLKRSCLAHESVDDLGVILC